MTLAQLILALITQAPAAITQIEALYETVKTDLTSNDQATIDAALASERAKLQPEETATDAALEAAEKY
ncbi:MAG: hypothetical protein ACREHF_02030 [Rhizomicrobium sp.]